MGLVNRAMRPLRAVVLATAGLVAAGAAPEAAQAQSFNYSPSYGYRAAGAFGGAGTLRAQSLAPVFQSQINHPYRNYGFGGYGNNFGNNNFNPYGNYGYGNTFGNNNFNPYGNYGYGNTFGNNNFNRSQGQNFARPPQNSSPSPSPSTTRQVDPTTKDRQEQINNARTSEDGSFTYVLNILKKDKTTGSLYYSNDHLIFPNNNRLNSAERERAVQFLGKRIEASILYSHELQKKSDPNSFYYLVSSETPQTSVTSSTNTSHQSTKSCRHINANPCCR